MDLGIPETYDYCSLLVIKMLPPFLQWCHFSPTSKGDSERGKGRMSCDLAVPSSNSPLASALLLLWAIDPPSLGLACNRKIGVKYPWNPFWIYQVMTLELNFEGIHGPEETGYRNCVNKGLLWVKNTRNWKTESAPRGNPPSGCAQIPWQTGPLHSYL